MATNSKIEWTTHTFNPWRGCTKVSAGCANCYAETMSKRNPKVLGIWGDNGSRVVASESMWREPHKWNAVAERVGEKHRVFCASLADVCEDRPELESPRARLKCLIRDTPNLNWLLLSKRPENYRRLFWNDTWPENVWAGTSVENQAAADERIPHLLQCPAAVRFLSVEPLLAPVRFSGPGCPACYGEGSLYCGYPYPCKFCFDIHWVIGGGESGSGCRPSHIDWHRSLRSQCRGAGIPYFQKQLGKRLIVRNDKMSEWPRDGDGLLVPESDHQEYQGEDIEVDLKDSKGGDMAEWPEDLRVREFPHAN